MRKLILLTTLMLGNPAWAAEFDCHACRDVYQYPNDFGNFAFNLVFGESPSLTLADGNRIRVENPAGQWAIVDLNFIIEDAGISFRFLFASFQLRAPNGSIQIVVQDPRGKQTTYEVFASSSDLLVGDGSIPTIAPPPPPPSSATTPNKSGGGNEIVDWGHEGAYYWYTSQAEFNLNIDGSM